MTKSEYINNPGRMASLPFWKEQKYGNLSTMKIIHEENYLESDYKDYSKKHYFKLTHRLNEIPRQEIDSTLEVGEIKKEQIELVAEFINQCYKNIAWYTTVSKISITTLYIGTICMSKR